MRRTFTLQVAAFDWAECPRCGDVTSRACDTGEYRYCQDCDSFHNREDALDGIDATLAAFEMHQEAETAFHWYPLGGLVTTACGLKAGTPGSTSTKNVTCTECRVGMVQRSWQ